MLAYECKPCRFFYREVELRKGKRCPECSEKAAPRLVLGGQVMGARE